MFTGFFYILRGHKVPVSLTEWMTLMETLDRGLIANLDDFYFLARAILIKSEAYFDHYDVAFEEYFRGGPGSAEIAGKILEWLGDPATRRLFNREELDALDKMSLEELFRELEKRLHEQTGPHDGGNYWIGRGGTSPFGHSGTNPAGIRIGGEGGGGHAVKIAQERRFRNYRADITLDVRQIKLALRGLRQLSRTGALDELDLPGTIDATARNVGDIELKWRRRRKNAVKVLLLMDAGGSMEPYALLCSQLFSAARSSTHFKDLQFYYFHNCIYDSLYRDIERRDAVSTETLFRTLETDYKVVLVGDATMSPYELMDKYGAIDYRERNDVAGLDWLKRVAGHFSHSAWLNPEEPRAWIHPTVNMISRVFPMYPLTLEGLGQAVRKLVVKR